MGNSRLAAKCHLSGEAPCPARRGAGTRSAPRCRRCQVTSRSRGGTPARALERQLGCKRIWHDDLNARRTGTSGRVGSGVCRARGGGQDRGGGAAQGCKGRSQAGTGLGGGEVGSVLDYSMRKSVDIEAVRL